MKTKLCFTLQHYDEAISGHFYYLYRLLEGLSQEADLFLIIERCNGKPNFPFAKKIYSPYFRFPLFKRLEIITYLLHIRFKGGCKKFYTHYSFYGALSTALITRFTGGESYLWMSIMLKEFSVDKTRPLRQFHRLFIIKYKILYRLIHYLVTSSSYMKDYYASNMGIPHKKIIVIPNWVDLKRYDRRLFEKEKVRKELKLPLKKFLILYVHTLEYGKGALDLPDIVYGVGKERSDICFIIVGEGRQRNWIGNEIKEKGVDNAAIITGPVPQREVPKYYAAADLFILPSRYEEFSRVLLEAMAMGVPFVATDGGGGATYAYTSPKQQEYVVSAGDISKFNQAVLQLSGDKNKREELIQDGLDFIKNYSEPVAVNNFVNKIIGSNLQVKETN